MRMSNNGDGVVLLDKDALIYLNLEEKCPSDLGLIDMDCEYSTYCCDKCIKEAFSQVKEVELRLILDEEKEVKGEFTIDDTPFDEKDEPFTNELIEDLFVYITKSYSIEDISYLVMLLNSYIKNCKTK